MMNTGKKSSAPLFPPAAEPDRRLSFFAPGLFQAIDRQTAEFLRELRQELQPLRQIAPGKLPEPDGYPVFTDGVEQERC